MIKQYFNKTKIKLILFYAIFSVGIYANEIELTNKNKQYLKPIMKKIIKCNDNTIENLIKNIDNEKKINQNNSLEKAFKLAQFKTETEKALKEETLKEIIEKIKNNELEINLNTNDNWREKAKLSIFNFFKIFIGGGHSTIKNTQLIEALVFKDENGYNTLEKDDLKYIIQTEHKDNYIEIKKDNNTFNEKAIDTHNFLRNYKTYFNTAIAWAGVIISVSIFILAINPKALINGFEWREESKIKIRALEGIGVLTALGIPYFSGLLAKKRIVNEIQKYIEDKLLKKEYNTYTNITNINNKLNEAFDQLCETNSKDIIQNLDPLMPTLKNKKIIENYVNSIDENEYLQNMSNIAWEIISQNAPDINELTEEEKELLKKIVINKADINNNLLELLLTKYITIIKEWKQENNSAKYEKIIVELKKLEEKKNISDFVNLLYSSKKEENKEAS